MSKKSAQSQSKSFDYYFGQGTKSFESGDCYSAIPAFTEALRKNPRHVKSYLKRGASYLKLFNYDKAMLDANKAVWLNPEYEEAYLLRGHIYLEMERYDDAITDFNKAIESDVTNSDAYLGRGIACLEKGSLEQSISDFRKVSKIRTKIAEPFLKLGDTYYKRGNHADAIDAYKQATKVREASLDACRKWQKADSRIGIWGWLNDASRILQHYKGDRELFDAFLHFMEVIDECKCNENRKDDEKIVRYSTRALIICPNNADALMCRADAYLSLKKWDEAISDYTKVIGHKKCVSSGGYFGRGLAYSGKGEYDLAICDFNKSIEERECNDGIGLYILANEKATACEKAGYLEDALKTFKELSKWNSTKELKQKIRELEGRIARENSGGRGKLSSLVLVK